MTKTQGAKPQTTRSRWVSYAKAMLQWLASLIATIIAALIVGVIKNLGGNDSP